jgi:hypothetical protein
METKHLRQKLEEKKIKGELKGNCFRLAEHVPTSQQPFYNKIAEKKFNINPTRFWSQ